MAALLAVALAVGIATISAPHIKAMLSASTKPFHGAAMADGFLAAAKPGKLHAPAKAAGPPEACAAPAGARSASTAPCPSARKAGPPPAANADCEIIVPAHPLTAAG
ncbi:MAG TPA: hypothetical protein VGY50_04905, partial [Streptosporangiaceae bacterium]|nr:hypothetical protein [Streptosporangiaceae bacterium]